MSSARSNSTTSAPSRAIASACDRPWPRAPPVMNTTLPSMRPITCSFVCAVWLLADGAGVHRQGEGGHVPRLIRDEEQDRIGDVARLNPGDRDEHAGLGCLGELLLGGLLEVGAEHVVGPLIHEHVGFNLSRVHAVDADPAGAQLVG